MAASATKNAGLGGPALFEFRIVVGSAGGGDHVGRFACAEHQRNSNDAAECYYCPGGDAPAGFLNTIVHSISPLVVRCRTPRPRIQARRQRRVLYAEAHVFAIAKKANLRPFHCPSFQPKPKTKQNHVVRSLMKGKIFLHMWHDCGAWLPDPAAFGSQISRIKGVFRTGPPAAGGRHACTIQPRAGMLIGNSCPIGDRNPWPTAKTPVPRRRA